MESKRLEKLVSLYKTAKASGDSYSLSVAESAIASFATAEASMVSMAVQEAAAAAAIGVKLNSL